MKKLLILFVAIIVTSASCFSYSARHSLYNKVGTSLQKNYFYKPKASSIYIQLFAYRIGNEVYDAARAAIIAEDDDIYIYKDAWAQQPKEYRRVSEWVYIGPPGYILQIHLYCPLLWDYASAQVYW